MTETKRERYIRILSGLDGATISAEACKELVELLKEQPHWIPCSERLPESQTVVIVSIRDDAGDTSFDYTSFGFTTPDNEYWVVDDEINYYVIAWMPLPVPYKEGKQ